jgi:hypothetical protein
MRVLSDMVTKSSHIYVDGLERIDLKCCVMGCVSPVRTCTRALHAPMQRMCIARTTHRPPRHPPQKQQPKQQRKKSTSVQINNINNHNNNKNKNNNTPLTMRRHSYMHCDRSIVPIKKHARGVVGGIVASFKNHVPPAFQHRTWEWCIEKARTDGNPYTFTQVGQEMIWDFKSYYENSHNVLHSKK